RWNNRHRRRYLPHECRHFNFWHFFAFAWAFTLGKYAHTSPHAIRLTARRTAKHGHPASSHEPFVIRVCSFACDLGCTLGFVSFSDRGGLVCPCRLSIADQIAVRATPALFPSDVVSFTAHRLALCSIVRLDDFNF